MSTITTLEQGHAAPSVLSAKSDDIQRLGPSPAATPVADDALPERSQRVFDVAPPNILSKRRRFAVSVLIILSNLIQVRCNLNVRFAQP